MKLHIVVTLDSGGTVTIDGEDLTAEGVNEVFAILGGYSVESVESEVTRQSLDEPLPNPPVPGQVTDAMKEGFLEGFQEGRVPQEGEGDTT